MLRCVAVAAAVGWWSCGSVECGEGTRLEGRVCVPVAPADAGSGGGGTAGGSGGGTVAGDGGSLPAELPTTALIEPMTVVEGFATCPIVQLGYQDGRTRTLLLDPTYRVPIARGLPAATSGLTFSFENTDGVTSGEVVPSCLAAVSGARAGTGLVTLRVSNAAGASAVVGTGSVTVLPLPATGDLGLRTTFPNTFPAASEYGALVVGEVRRLDITPVLQLPPTTTGAVGLIPLARMLTITSSDPSRLALQGDRQVRALQVGPVTLTATWSFAGRSFTAPPLAISVIEPRGAPAAIVFDVPEDDAGAYLPERARFLERLNVGQCFSTKPWAGFFGTSFSVLARRPDFVVEVLGSALQAAGDNRWCAVSEGDAAVRACVAGVCGVFGVVVNEAPQAPTLTATVTPTTVTTTQPSLQTVCLALSVTAEWSSGVRQDVSTSPALRFAKPFQISPFFSLDIVTEPATGLPQRMQGKTCFTVDPTGDPKKGFRVFYAGSVVEVAVTVRPP